MKLEKIQSLILKAAIRKIETEKETPWIVSYSEEDGVVYVTEGHFIMSIPERKFVLDVDLLGEIGKRPCEPKTFKGFYSMESDAKAAYKTNEIRKVDKGEVVKIESEDGSVHAWIDRNFLKFFEDDEDTNFTVINRKSPVFVYEFGELVGAILPVNIQE